MTSFLSSSSSEQLSVCFLFSPKRSPLFLSSLCPKLNAVSFIFVSSRLFVSSKLSVQLISYFYVKSCVFLVLLSSFSFLPEFPFVSRIASASPFSFLAHFCLAYYIPNFKCLFPSFLSYSKSLPLVFLSPLHFHRLQSFSISPRVSKGLSFS